MPKCTITFEDTADGGTSVSIDFDPPLDNPLHGHEPSPAQELGWAIAQRLAERASDVEDELSE